MATAAKKAKKEILAERVSPEISHLPFKFVENHSSRTAKLIANSGATSSVEGQNRWFEYQFKEPVFIYRVVVNETNYPDYKLFEIEVTLNDGRIIKNRAAPSSGKVYLEVNSFAKSFRFRPPKAYLSLDKKIDSIEIFGFDRSEAGKFIQFCRDIESAKLGILQEIEAREEQYQATIQQAAVAQQQLTDAQKSVSELKVQSDRIKAAIKRLDTERTEQSAKLAAVEAAIAESASRLVTINREVESRATRNQTLSEQIAGHEEKLAELRSNIALFPSELSDFVKQGKSNAETLFYLSLAPIAIIFVMFILLVSGAVELTTKITTDQNINILALIVSRFPYVFIAFVIITASYKIASYFINELIFINRMRLNLTKISIIAKDVSSSAEAGLGLNDMERYGVRLKLKMDLMRDHLKGYIRSDFETEMPKQITSYFPFEGLRKKTAPEQTTGEGALESAEGKTSSEPNGKQAVPSPPPD